MTRLHEGYQGYGAYYYNATAKHYHEVANPDGPLESSGPMLENDSRLIERHLRRLSQGRPVDAVVTDLLENSMKELLKSRR